MMTIMKVTTMILLRPRPGRRPILFPSHRPLSESPANTADDVTTSSAAATPSRKDNSWVNPAPWSKLYRKLQQHSDKPIDNPTADALNAGINSSRSPSTEFKPAPKDSEASVTEQVESSLEIPETLAAPLGKIRREEDDHSEDGEKHYGGSTQTVDGASMVAGDAAVEVD